MSPEQLDFRNGSFAAVLARLPHVQLRGDLGSCGCAGEFEDRVRNTAIITELSAASSHGFRYVSASVGVLDYMRSNRLVLHRTTSAIQRPTIRRCPDRLYD